jgi:hypothetical protein
VPYTSSVSRGGDHLGAALSVATPLTSSPITPRGKSLTRPTSMTMATIMTLANKGDSKKKNRFRDKKKKKFQKIMSRACAALSDFDFSSEDSSSS